MAMYVYPDNTLPPGAGQELGHGDFTQAANSYTVQLGPPAPALVLHNYYVLSIGELATQRGRSTGSRAQYQANNGNNYTFIV